MSLILEALKKVEREKQAREHGTVVIRATPWAAPRRRRWPMAAALAVTAGLGAAAAVLLRPSSPEAGRAPVPLASVPPPSTAAEAAVAPPFVPPAPAILLRPSIAGRPPAPSAEPAAAQTAAAPPEAVAVAPAVPIFRLQAISEQDGQPVAMLNERLVRVGDVVDGARVVRIGAAEVEVEIDGHLRTVKF